MRVSGGRPFQLGASVEHESSPGLTFPHVRLTPFFSTTDEQVRAAVAAAELAILGERREIGGETEREW